MRQHHVTELYALNLFALHITRDLFTSVVTTIPELLAMASTLKASATPEEQAAIDRMTQEVLIAVLQGVETTTNWLSALLDAAIREASPAPIHENPNGRDEQGSARN